MLMGLTGCVCGLLTNTAPNVNEQPVADLVPRIIYTLIVNRQS